MGEFVEPNVDRLVLSGDNRWIDVKRELNAGEYDAMNASVLKDVRAGEVAPTLDFQKAQSYKIAAYLVGWSFIDSKGKPVPVSAAAIANLKKATRDEIGKLIEAHDSRSEAVVDDRKNDNAPDTSAVSGLLE